MRIIVSFTSYLARIGHVHKVIESLYLQTMQADEIILYLSLEEFPEAEANLPETLRYLIGQNGFRVEWVHGNLKSHKKYFYALQEYQDAIVITVDDDKIYAETMISELIDSYKRFPKAISARNVRIIVKNGKALEPYCRWEVEKYMPEYMDVPRMDLCAIGAGGVCYAPSLVNDKWFDQETILGAFKNNDDLWLKYNEIINNIPVVYTKSLQEDTTIEDSQVYNLTASNLYGNGNDECICKLLALLEEQNNVEYQKWFQNLMTWDEYIAGKKRYCVDNLSTVFDEVGNVPVYLYGAGRIAQCCLRALSDWGMIQRIAAIIVSEQAENPLELYGIQVKPLSEINVSQKFGIIFGVNETNRKEITDRLTGYNYLRIEFNLQVIRRYYSC